MTFYEELEEYEPHIEAYNKQQKEIKDLHLELNDDELIPKPMYPKKPHDPLYPKKPIPSIQESQSVGRILLSLVKTDAPSRWWKISGDPHFKKQSA